MDFYVGAFSSCFEDIGCIEFTERWFHEKHRPHNLEPLDRHTIRTEFLLMKNPKNDTNHLVYDIMSFRKETIQVAGFKKGTCSIFVIHDFTSNGYTGWIKHLVVAISKRTDCNIISVDWESGAEPPFDQAISNARVVALEAKYFLDVLKTYFNQTADNLHFVGHGVGAHIAGYIGKYVFGVQRITGLDPTGPRFEKMPKEVRLDADDARYVEILHTDAFNHRSQGGKISHGHADFYINNAEHQPGCNDTSQYPSFLDLHRDNMQEGKILPACSHKRSFKYYIQALEVEDCKYIGIRCPNINDFKLGKCNNCQNAPHTCGRCATFGLQPPSTNSRNNSYFLVTNSKKPFCLVTYAVNITIEKGDVGREVEGFFQMILIDEDNKVSNSSHAIYGKNVRKFNSGKTYPFVFYGSPPALSKIKEAKVKWTYKSKKLCILCDKKISVREMTIEKLAVKHNTNGSVDYICPLQKGVTMKTGDYVQFQTCEKLYGPDYLKNGHIQTAIMNNSQGNQTGKALAANQHQVLPLCDIGEPTSHNTTSAHHGNTTTQALKPKSATEITSTPKISRTSTKSPTQAQRSVTEPSFESPNEIEMFLPTPINNLADVDFGVSFDEYPARSVTLRRDLNATAKELEETKDIKSFKDCFDEQKIVTTTEECTIDKKSIRRLKSKKKRKKSRGASIKKT